MDYGLLIAVEVIEALDRLPKRARRKLLDQFYNTITHWVSYCQDRGIDDTEQPLNRVAFQPARSASGPGHEIHGGLWFK